MKPQDQAKQEGPVAEAIESQTAKLPSDLFLWLAIGAMGASASLQLARQKHAALFFGQWVAPFLLFGIYNKLVKQSGHDAFDKQTAGQGKAPEERDTGKQNANAIMGYKL
jgi:hypothetical protein